MYHENDEDTTTILELDKLDDYDLVTLPDHVAGKEDEQRDQQALF
jgi:hypothetical protein